MKLPKIAKWSKCEVVWMDATVTNETDSIKFKRSYNPCIRHTLGYYVGTKYNNAFFAETDDREADVWNVVAQDCDRIQAIPVGMITQLSVLKRMKIYQ